MPDDFTDAAQVALLLAHDGVLTHDDLCVFIKHWGRLRNGQESFAVGKNWKRSLRNLMKKLSTFVSPSEDTWTLANPGAPPPPLYTETRRVNVTSVAALRKIFPPISAQPSAPRPAILAQPRPKRQSAEMPAPSGRRSSTNSDEVVLRDDRDVDVAGAEEVVVVKKKEPKHHHDKHDKHGGEEHAEKTKSPAARSPASRGGGKMSKADLRELFENVSSPLVQVRCAVVALHVQANSSPYRPM